MDAILPTWFARADALCPQWRSVVHGGGGSEEAIEQRRRRALVFNATPVERMSLAERVFGRARALTAIEQIQVREVLEILALALRVDPGKCIELACENQTDTPLRVSNSEAFHEDEVLKLTIQADLAPTSPASTTFFQVFFVDWSEAIASDAFNVAKHDLEGLVRARSRQKHRFDMHRFDMELALTLRSDNHPYEILSLAPMVQLLESIDRSVFRVVQITLTIKHSVYNVEELTAFFRLLHDYRDDTADVQIKFQMCQDMTTAVDLGRWKTLFDLLVRKSFPSDTREVTGPRKNHWDIEVKCGGHGYGDPECGTDRSHVLTDARLVAACFSALANASSYVTSIHLIHPLKDKTSDYRGPRDRDVRAYWLGYLLRSGVVERLTIDEEYLTPTDANQILSILEAPSLADCFKLLWRKKWHRPLEESLPNDVPMFKHIDNVETFLSDPNEVLGVMKTTNFGEASQSVDVFLVGYGQCTIPRSQLASVEASSQTNSNLPERKSRLKSLTLNIRSCAPLVRILPVIGHDLEELTIDGGVALSEFSTVLEISPNLRRLSLKSLNLSADDDINRLPQSTEQHHPLKVLELGLEMDRASPSGLRGLCDLLILHGLDLRGFRIGASASVPHRYSFVPAALPAMDKMLKTCCHSCTTIEISSLPIEYFASLFKPGFRALGTLLLKVVVWTPAAWTALFAALSSPKHPLAQSLHTLAIRMFVRDRDFVAAVGTIETAIVSMLESNRWLVNLRLETLVLRDAPAMMATNGIELKRSKFPFTMRHKAAVLSVLNATALPWESFVIARIFQFVIEPEIRRVAIGI